jgi:hypothetical protein
MCREHAAARQETMLQTAVLHTTMLQTAMLQKIILQQAGCTAHGSAILQDSPGKSNPNRSDRQHFVEDGPHSSPSRRNNGPEGHHCGAWRQEIHA